MLQLGSPLGRHCEEAVRIMNDAALRQSRHPPRPPSSLFGLYAHTLLPITSTTTSGICVTLHFTAAANAVLVP
ncbi:hypothetical protein E2C01_077599 [Portunus trituberculatus]|uniref:Uncharacterized protein n=1 Tax=Portunus trituberculatus TaxID=210409 RepID=A0A5B7IEW0_PORTR|nr:hypothetical protein [Portunus trituberculatus]